MRPGKGTFTLFTLVTCLNSHEVIWDASTCAPGKYVAYQQQFNIWDWNCRSSDSSPSQSPPSHLSPLHMPSPHSSHRTHPHPTPPYHTHIPLCPGQAFGWLVTFSMTGLEASFARKDALCWCLTPSCQSQNTWRSIHSVTIHFLPSLWNVNHSGHLVLSWFPTWEWSSWP